MSDDCVIDNTLQRKMNWNYRQASWISTNSTEHTLVMQTFERKKTDRVNHFNSVTLVLNFLRHLYIGSISFPSFFWDKVLI